MERERQRRRRRRNRTAHTTGAPGTDGIRTRTPNRDRNSAMNDGRHDPSEAVVDNEAREGGVTGATAEAAAAAAAAIAVASTAPETEDENRIRRVAGVPNVGELRKLTAAFKAFVNNDLAVAPEEIERVFQSLDAGKDIDIVENEVDDESNISGEDGHGQGNMSEVTSAHMQQVRGQDGADTESESTMD